MLCSTVGPGNTNALKESIPSCLFICSCPHSLLLPRQELRIEGFPNNHSALKNVFLGDVQPSRPGQWLEDWDVTSQSNGVYPVAAARSKASSPASRGSLSLPCLPRPVVIPSTPWWSRTARPQYFILLLHWHTSLLLQPFWVPVYTAPRRIALFKGFFAWPQ